MEEMPPPLSQEFGLEEARMGMDLEESLGRLNKEMDSEDLNLMATAILVARETGGNLLEVFSRLSESIRQKSRIFEQIKSLAAQARWQGVIMSALPVVFSVFYNRAIKYGLYELNPLRYYKKREIFVGFL